MNKERVRKVALSTGGSVSIFACIYVLITCFHIQIEAIEGNQSVPSPACPASCLQSNESLASAVGAGVLGVLGIGLLIFRYRMVEPSLCQKKISVEGFRDLTDEEAENRRQAFITRRSRAESTTTLFNYCSHPEGSISDEGDDVSDNTDSDAISPSTFPAKYINV